MFKDLLIRKPIDQLMKEASNTRELKRVLGPLNLTTLGIGAIIGAGIFVLTGQAAALYAGPAIVFSFIFSGFGAAMAALCYAEFASTVPISGSAYTYAYATLGELFAWIIGWDLMLEYLFGASTVAVGWSGYVVSFLEDFGITIPSYLSSAPLRQDPVLGWQTTGAFLNLPAMFIVAVMTVLLLIGIKESAVFNNIVVLVKISVLLLFITFGIAYIKTGNWGSVHTAEYGRIRTFWLERHFARGGCDILCLFRFRCCLHGGAGGTQSEKRYAHRDNQLPCSIYGTVHCSFACVDGSGKVRPASRARPDSCCR